MKRRKRLCGVILIIAALVIMTLPRSEADAASSASDFVIEGSTLVKYRGKETSVSVPDTVTAIGKSAFEDNTNIELVVLPNSVTKIGAYAFWGCDNLDTVVLGRGLTSVGDYAFAGCKGLQQMSIPSNVTSIGIQAFADCVNMTDITIPKETTRIDDTAFDGCAKLTIHCTEGTVAYGYAQEFYERQKEMPEYEDVSGYTGDDTEEPSGETSSDTVSSGDASDTPEETEPVAVVTPADEGRLLGSTQIVGNHAFVFLDSSSLQTVEGTDASAMVGTSEDDRIYADDGSLLKYAYVDGEIVADQAYYKSRLLGSLSLPQGLKAIGQFSFARSSVTDVTIPEGVEEIDYGAFYHCDALAGVSIPESVMNVEPKAFTYTGWVDSFLQDASAGDFLIDGGVLVAYRGESASVTVPEGVRVIAAEAFQNHEEIEELAMPQSLRVIGEAAFEGCSSLKKISLNQGLVKIKDRAFLGTADPEILVPASVQEVGLLALEGADVTYEGDTPRTSFETSAGRLSNEAYRGLSGQTSDKGVTVTGVSGASAYLEGAERAYSLSIERAEDTASMQKAWQRTFKEDMPEDIAVYDMELTDAVDIPLTKLGSRTLSIVIPLDEEFAGQEVKAVSLDRNGQLQFADARRVLSGGQDALLIQTNKPSRTGIYKTGEVLTEEPEEADVTIEAAAALPADNTEETKTTQTGVPFGIRVAFGAVLFVTGLWLFASTFARKK